MNIQSPDEQLKNSTGKSAPSISEDLVNDGPSTTSIRNIPVRNTHDAGEYGGSVPKMPSKLPFD